MGRPRIRARPIGAKIPLTLREGLMVVYGGRSPAFVRGQAPTIALELEGALIVIRSAESALSHRIPG